MSKCSQLHLHWVITLFRQGNKFDFVWEWRFLPSVMARLLLEKQSAMCCLFLPHDRGSKQENRLFTELRQLRNVLVGLCVLPLLNICFRSSHIVWIIHHWSCALDLCMQIYYWLILSVCWSTTIGWLINRELNFRFLYFRNDDHIIII